MNTHIFKEVLQNVINEAMLAFQQPNNSIDSYRCYYEGRKKLAEELLLAIPVSTAQKEDSVIDEIAGIMYKNTTDEADDGCWIDGKDFHKVARIIYQSLLTAHQNKQFDENDYKKAFEWVKEQNPFKPYNEDYTNFYNVAMHAILNYKPIQQNKEEKERADHWKGEAEHWYSEAHRLQKIIDENNVPGKELLYTENQLFTMATNVAEWATSNHKEAGKQSMPEWREFYKKYFLNRFKKNVEYLKRLNNKTKAP